MKRKPKLYTWNKVDHDLDYPLISPHLIPDGYVQDWNKELRRYVLRKNADIIRWYKPNKTDMDEENAVVEAPVEAENAPESVPEAEVEETPVETAEEATEPVEPEQA